MALAAMLVALTFGTGGAGGGLALHPAWLAFPVSLAMALGVGALVGWLNGTLVVRFEINAFIVTLASYIWGRGLVVALSGGRSVYGLPDALRGVAVTRLLGIPMLAWVLVATYAVFALMLAKTPFGRHLYMIGGNPTASARAGIAVGRNVTLAFVLSGLLAGLAGWLLASRTAGATANLGIGMLFQAFAAVVIGGVSLKGGQGRLSGVFAGVLLLSSIQTAINVMGHAAALHHDDPGHAGPRRRPPRHRQERPPPPLSLKGAISRCTTHAQRMHNPCIRFHTTRRWQVMGVLAVPHPGIRPRRGSGPTPGGEKRPSGGGRPLPGSGPGRDSSAGALLPERGGGCNAIRTRPAPDPHPASARAEGAARPRVAEKRPPRGRAAAPGLGAREGQLSRRASFRSPVEGATLSGHVTPAIPHRPWLGAGRDAAAGALLSEVSCRTISAGASGHGLDRGGRR